MKAEYLFYLIALLLLAGCISGPPRDLKDAEVMWVEIENKTPIQARDLIIEGITQERFLCRRREYRARLTYGCGQGPSSEDVRQVKGRCQQSPTSPNNSVCDVFLVSTVKTGLYRSQLSQPKNLRGEIETAVLNSTGGRQILRPFPRNSWFYVDLSIPRWTAPQQP